MVNNTKTIREEFIRKFKNEEFNNSGLIEILGASFIADSSYIFGTPNKEYIDKEIRWYRSKSRNVYDMYNPPSIWKEIADNEGNINSNYGWCIYSEDNHRQYYNALLHLRQNPNSRQASMIYNRPSMHTDAFENGMKDFMCTNAVSYNINTDNKLDCVVQMRSNDIVYGYKNDYAWQEFVLHSLARDLGIKPGTIYWQVASLHMYPRHFKFLDI